MSARGRARHRGRAFGPQKHKSVVSGTFAEKVPRHIPGVRAIGLKTPVTGAATTSGSTVARDACVMPSRRRIVGLHLACGAAKQGDGAVVLRGPVLLGAIGIGYLPKKHRRFASVQRGRTPPSWPLPLRLAMHRGSGKEHWRHRSGSVWETATYDPQSDTFYQGIGNAGPDLDTEYRLLVKATA
jgi:hypothetical protein